MKSPKNVPEEFLQYIWSNRLFNVDSIRTSKGEKLEILNPGKLNTNAGPDFFNAKIKIGDTLWAGNVEIHKKASDWKAHRHENDEAYNTIILHVVEENDVEIKRTNGESIPAFVMQYPEYFAENYQKLLYAKTWIACENQFFKIDPIVLRLGFNRLMIERLENKTQEIVKRLEQNQNNWNETFYQFTARMFGFKVNALPFELLAKSLPLSILAKHKNSLFQLEALLFGNSGLLNNQLLGDDYYLSLREEYSFLYKKYQLKAIEGHLWKFLRLRPANFPGIRISQFAALLHSSANLFSKVLESERIDELKKLFKVQASAYWQTHYNFNQVSKRSSKKELGETAITIFIINVVIPFLFVYGEKCNKPYLKNRALEFLELLPAENNSIISKWHLLGIEARSAFDTQALLQLKNYYCESKKCLNCHIGVKLLTNPKDQKN